MLIGKYQISNTRGKSKELHRLRVRRNEEVIAEVFPARLDPDRGGHSDPYKFVRTWPQSKSRKHFVDQLRLNGVTEEELIEILTIPKI